MTRAFKSGRCGIAQFEFILTLVVLLPLFLALLWLGYAGSVYVGVICDARHQAWRDRNRATSKPFNFENATQGRIEKIREEKVEFIPMLDSWANLQSKHILYAGTWGHPEIDLNKEFPNYKYMAELAVKAPEGRAANISALVAGMKGFLKIDYKRIKSSADDMASEIRDIIEKKLKTAMPFLEGIASDLSTANRESNDIAKVRIEKIEKRLIELNTQLGKAQNFISKFGGLTFAKLKLDKLTPEVLQDEKKLSELFGQSAEGKRIAGVAKQLTDVDVKDLLQLQGLGADLDAAIKEINREREILILEKGALGTGLS